MAAPPPKADIQLILVKGSANDPKPTLTDRCLIHSFSKNQSGKFRAAPFGYVPTLQSARSLETDRGIAMTLDQFANLAEIIGVIIVVITLIYLSVQVRQNTQALHSTGAQATHDTLTTGDIALATNGDLNRLFRTGTQDPSTLTEDETGQFFAFWTYIVFMTQNWLYQRDTRALDEKLANTWLPTVSAAFHSAGFKFYWEHRKHQFSEDVHIYVDEALAQPPIRPGYKVLAPSVE